ncbi:hypothetical protein [Methanocella sp. MCL-LM]|uniref:hypothetical protein n=1 Tax=Methanocella sp. MCL-LM TaxID=3412035 RepID=UPI003C762851
MTIKLKLRYLLVLSLLIIPLLVSGCTTSRAGGDTTATATPTAVPTATPTATPTPTPTPVPGSSGTLGSGGVPGSAVVTPTPTPAPATPTPVSGAAPFNNPYANPGWPTYGVNVTLVIITPVPSATPSPSASPSPTPTPTGSIYGSVYEPEDAYPEPTLVDSESFGVFVMSVADPATNWTLSLNSDSGYEVTGLSYGDYEVSWFYAGHSTLRGTETVTLGAASVEHNIRVYWM